MIHFQVRHLMGVLKCHQLIAVPITTGKKKIQLSGHHLLRRSNCHCCTVPITMGKQRYSHLSIVTPFQLQPEKKDTVVWPSFVAPFQLPLLRRSNYDRKKKIQSSVHCYAVPNTTRKKRKKMRKKLFM